MSQRGRVAGRSTPRKIAPLLGATLAALLPAMSAPAAARTPVHVSVQDEQAPKLSAATAREIAGEGALGNPAILVNDETAAAALFDGDRAFGRARATGAQKTDQDLRAAFEAWQRALESSRVGAAVPFAPAPERAPPDAGTPPHLDRRRSEGIEVAVLRRIASLTAVERAAWRARFEPQASDRLRALFASAARGAPGFAGVDAHAAAVEAGLARLERDFPATNTAARAGFALMDLARAEGRTLAARTWYDRARRHTQLLDSAAGLRAGTGAVGSVDGSVDWSAALAARQPSGGLDGFDGFDGANVNPQLAEWERASAYDVRAALPLSDPYLPAAPNTPGEMGRGLRPGLAWLADGRAAIQSAGRVLVLAPDGAGFELAFEPVSLLPDDIGEPTLPYSPPGQPGWLLEPAARGTSIAIVEGRATARGGLPNVLLRIDLPPALDGLAPPDGVRTALPELVWALRGELGTHRAAQGNADAAPAQRITHAALANAELQPGPLWLDQHIVVQARRGEGEIEGLLAAVDATTGAPLWVRSLVRGGERGPASSRFAPGLIAWGAAAPPVAGERGMRILAATHLGAVSLVDALDGRIIYTLLNQRAAGSEPLWSGARPVAVPGGFLVAPVDSDFLYRLPDGPFGDGELDGPNGFPRAPEPRAEAVELIGHDESGALVIARIGPRQGLRTIDLARGDTLDAVHFLPGEEAREGALVGGQRVALATDRALWVFSKEDGLYLKAEHPLPMGPLGGARAGLPGAFGQAPRRIGGSVHGRGARLLVLELDRLLVFNARR